MKKALSCLAGISILLLVMAPAANADTCTYQQIQQMIKDGMTYQQIVEACNLGEPKQNPPAPEPIVECASGWYLPQGKAACEMLSYSIGCDNIKTIIDNSATYKISADTKTNLEHHYSTNCGPKPEPDPQEPAVCPDNHYWNSQCCNPMGDLSGLSCHTIGTFISSPSTYKLSGTTVSALQSYYSANCPQGGFPDSDGDGVPNSTDNCPNNANKDQADNDADGIGNVCDTTPNGNGGATPPADSDGDGIPNTTDNCPNNANADQKDTDSDGTGDACDTTPNGGGQPGGGTPGGGTPGGGTPGGQPGGGSQTGCGGCGTLPVKITKAGQVATGGTGGKGITTMQAPGINLKNIEQAKYVKACLTSKGKLSFDKANNPVCTCSKYANAWDNEKGCMYVIPAHSDLNWTCAPWANQYIVELRSEGTMIGYGNDQFKPCQFVSRAEMLKLAMAAAGYGPYECEGNSCPKFFPDLYNWQKPWVSQAYMLEVVEGYPNGHLDKRIFHPNRWVTRAEAVKMALASFGVDPGTYEKSYFTDVVDWSKPWVEKARLLGIVKGVGGTVFEPSRPMMRAEAAKVIYLLKKYVEAMKQA